MVNIFEKIKFCPMYIKEEAGICDLDLLLIS